MRKKYITPATERVRFAYGDDFCAGSGETNPGSEPPDGYYDGGFGGSPARKLYV